MRVLEQAAQIVEAGFYRHDARLGMPQAMGEIRGMNLTVDPGDPIEGHLRWTNLGIQPGSVDVHGAYLLGWLYGEQFQPITITVYGSQWWYGSRHTRLAPNIGALVNSWPKSWALEFGQQVTLDAFTFIASGTLGSAMIDGRSVGINPSHFGTATIYTALVFQNVLTITAGGPQPLRI